MSKDNFWEGYVPEPVKPAPVQDVTWGVDWGKAGDIPCVSIIKRLPGGGIEVVAVEYAPYSYTSPPAQRKPLTDEAIATVYWGATGQSLRPQDNVLAHNFARSIEAAHGIKENT